MAHTVQLGFFGKRLNSTAQPTVSSWASYSVTLKEETSLDDPVLLLNASFSTVAAYNYGVFMGQYYWITDIIAVRTNVVEVHMSLDYMATYRNTIMLTSAFIEYGFNTVTSGPVLEDNRIPSDLKPAQHTKTEQPYVNLISPVLGSYIVQAVGNDPAPTTLTETHHHGLMAFYLDGLYIDSLIESISPSISTDIQTILAGSYTPNEILNQLTGYAMEQNLLMDSAFGAIQSIQWVPFSPTNVMSGERVEIYLGNYGTGIQGFIVPNHSPFTSDVSIDIPWPFTSLTDPRNMRSQILLYLPFFGTVPIPTDKVIGISAIDIHSSVEYLSGSLSVRVKAGDYTLFTGSTNVAVSYGFGRSSVLTTDSLSGSIQQLGGAIKVGTGVLDLGASVVGAALGIGAGGISGAIGSIAGGFVDQLRGTAQQIQPTISCVGALGGSSATGQSMYAEISLLYYGAYDAAAFQSVYGHPVMKIGVPASGYCKTAGFSINVPGHAKHAALINATMDGGAFIE